MWEISKEFDFCYGHRVWSQSLNVEFSLDSCLMCRHLHGHQGKVIVYLKSDTLKSGMVTDFKHLNWFKKFLDDVIDHKFIIDINDPLFATLLPNIDKKDLILPLDTHTFKVSQKLGLLDRKNYDLKSALLITDKLKEFDKLDPIKYDFSLYRIGQEKISLN